MARTGVRVSAIIIRNNKVLLIHRKKPLAEYWVFPGGGVEDGETLNEALIREVKEETNLDVIESKIIFKVKFDNDHDILQPFFLCKTSGGRPEIIGEEKEINCPENYYRLEWKKISDLKSVNLVPVKAKENLIKYNLTKYTLLV
jgi:8-oxo-dGTP diphosphatase